MKTSNKLLIAFALALIVIPMLGMVYISRARYKVGTYADKADRKIENFSTPTANMSSVPVATAFQSVSIADAKKLTINLRFVKDDKFGIKVPNTYKDLISTAVDASGQLQIQVQASGNKAKRGDYIDIYVYAPNLSTVTIGHADEAYLTATVDSINFVLNNTSSASLGSGAHVKFLNISATEVDRLHFNEDDVKSISAKLANTNFYSEQISYDQLSLTTSGNCELKLVGSYNNQTPYSIKNLMLNTTGAAKVELENIRAVNASGSFSDETIVQMPAANINQMYKK